MVYKYLGWGITNENGVAKLDHDAQGQEIEHSYTGTGAGEIDVLASLDNPIVEGSIVSETYSVWDTLWYDEATENSHRDDWSSTITPQYVDDGTIISESSGTSTNITANYTAIENVIIEMKLQLMESTTSNNIRFKYKGADRYLKTYLSDLNKHDFKFVVANGECTLFVDGVEQSTKQSTTSATVMQFTINNASIKFNNIKIYQI